MITTALKLDAPKEIHFPSTKPKTTSPWLKRFLNAIRETTKAAVLPSPDIDAWRRLEYKNEFAHERRQHRIYWGH